MPSATVIQPPHRATPAASEPSADPFQDLRRQMPREELDGIFRRVKAKGASKGERLLISAIAAFDNAVEEGHLESSTDYYLLLQEVADSSVGDVLLKLDEDSVLEQVVEDRKGWISAYFGTHYDERRAHLFGAAGSVVADALRIQWDPHGPMARTWRVERYRGADSWEVASRCNSLRESIGRMRDEIRALTALRRSMKVTK